MRYYIKQYSETVMNIAEIMIQRLRKEEHLVGAERCFRDLLEDFHNDMLGIRDLAQKEEGFEYESNR